MLQKFKNSLRQKARLIICLKIRGQVIQALVHWAFEALKENQKLNDRFSQVYKKFEVNKSLKNGQSD